MGVRVNAICPGTVDCDDSGSRASVKGKLLPLGRWGSPADIAAGVVFLASDDSAFVAGLDLRIDGGLLAECA